MSKQVMLMPDPNKNTPPIYQAIVIGSSAGGFVALKTLLPTLSTTLNLPIFIAQHRKSDSDSFLSEYLDSKCTLSITEAKDKQHISSNQVYIAPPNYHLLVESSEQLALSQDEPVCFARPSIDVLFESAADIYDSSLIGVILTGANSDGSEGAKKIKDRGGTIVLQNPKNADSPQMPSSVLAVTSVDQILHLDEIGPAINKLVLESKGTFTNR